MKVSYTDGEELEAHIGDLIAAAQDVSSLSTFGAVEFDNWPVRYHLCPERGNLFRHLDFSRLDVLELGAGMGGASRVVAESAASFLAVEGTEPRLRALRKRMRGLENWEAVASNIDAFETDRRFDVVLLVGVLEYAELYTSPPDGSSAFTWMMDKAVSLLKPGGVVAVAIENRNGIKYWAGAPEDHTGQMFDGICGYPSGKSVRTFSRSSLLELFRGAGIGEVEEFYPWPDYKTPHCVVSKRLVDDYSYLAVGMAVDAVMREPVKGVRFFPTSIALYQTAGSGLYSEFANSFLFLGGAPGGSSIRSRLLRRLEAGKERAWHYSLSRRTPIRTVLSCPDGADQAPVVQKEALRSPTEGLVAEQPVVLWEGGETSRALLDDKLNRTLRRTAYFDGVDRFVDDLVAFLEWSFSYWGREDGDLDGKAFDAISQNTVKTADGYAHFDLEWRLPAPMRKSWFILRNVYNLATTLRLCQSQPFGSANGLYESACERVGVTPDLEGDLLLEASAQAAITGFVTPEQALASLTATMSAPIRPATFPRDASLEQFKRLELAEGGDSVAYLKSLNEENQRLRDQLGRRCVKIGLALDARLRRIKPLYSLIAKVYKRGKA